MYEHSARMQKLRWSCRRGMKELDEVLTGFVSAQREVLERGGWPGFECLLGEEDHHLWQWLVGGIECQEPLNRDIIDAVRKNG